MVDPWRGRLLLEQRATWSELEVAVCFVVAGTLRNNAQAVEAARRRAHDLLDQHLDLKIESITAIRLDVEKQFRLR